MTSVRARVVVALWSEARPLIDRFDLRAVDSEGPFRRFSGDAVTLVVSGVGRAAAAAAAGYLFACERRVRERPWINVGIGGHRSLVSGEAILADRVIEHGSGRVWYPPLVFEPPIRTSTVCTVDEVEREYADDAVYEMEAAGFYPTTARFSTAELVQVVKIVSDGPKASPDGLTAKHVSKLMSSRLDDIVAVIGRTREVAGELELTQPRVATAPWLERWHFTVTQKRRLRRLLARLRVVDPAFRDTDAALARAAELPDATAVLARLQEDLES
ncbi:MAG: hypothetical protein OES47_09495 [Acidobacteriota bacterium]|nr:hypothetical protein [Acidobacteriota bacterium]